MAKPHTADGQGTNPEVRFERSDIDLGSIVKFGVGFVGLVAVTIALTIGMFRFLRSYERTIKETDLPKASEDAKRPSPEPRLEAIDDVGEGKWVLAPPRGKADLAKQEKILSNTKGILPIEQAIDDLADHLPYRKGKDSSAEQFHQASAEQGRCRSRRDGRTMMQRMVLVAFACLLSCSPAVPAEPAEPADLLGSKEKFFKPHLGDRVPLDLTFKDEAGRKVQLGDYGRTKPIVLVLAWYRCPMLCSMVLNDLVKGLRGVPFAAGEEYEVVVVSFDARETPALAKAKKDAYLEEFAQPGAEKGWHFLTGEQSQIDKLTETVGFRAIWDEKGQQFAHARGILILTGDWMVTRYFIEGDFPPRDLRLALVEASEGRVGSPVDRVLLMCFNYNPVTGRYSVSVLNAVRLGGIGMIVLLLGFWLVSWQRGRSRSPHPPSPPLPPRGEGGAGQETPLAPCRSREPSGTPSPARLAGPTGRGVGGEGSEAPHADGGGQ